MEIDPKEDIKLHLQQPELVIPETDHAGVLLDGTALVYEMVAFKDAIKKKNCKKFTDHFIHSILTTKSRLCQHICHLVFDN